MNKQLIICIGREYGSGGHEIGEKLAAKLGIDFFDRNLLEEVASEKKVDVENLTKYDERPRRIFFSRTVRGYSNSPEENIAEMQFALLKQKAADEDSFVIVGRCATEIFTGIAPFTTIFITADDADKTKRIMERRNFDEKKAQQAIIRHNKKRAAYHNHFCQNKWGEVNTYDLCVNSSRLGIDGTVDFLYQYIQDLGK